MLDDVYLFFLCFLKKVEEFHNLAKKIISLPSKVYFTMVQLDCEELKQGLANKAKGYADLLLEKLVIRQRQQSLL